MAESTLGTGNVERAQQLLEAAMSGTGMLGKSASALINTAAERLSEEATDLTEAGVEDFQPPSSGKYDEEEEASLSEDKRNAVQSLKLTRQELSSLVPPDWDTVNLEVRALVDGRVCPFVCIANTVWEPMMGLA